jgi:S1-C subfamily serine protease
MKAKSSLNMATPMDIATTNDIIGGNSGSPVINKDAEVVGLIFDGNIHSLVGDVAFDADKARAVAVDSRGLIESLKVVYHADGLVQELTGK